MVHEKFVGGFEDRNVQFRCFGNILDYDPQSTDREEQLQVIEALARDMGAKRVLWQILANDKDRDARFRVVRAGNVPRANGSFGHINYNRCDGVVLDQSGDAVAFTSRDCPILILWNPHGTPVAVLHCSRSSLQGADIGQSGRSVFKEAFDLCAGGFLDCKEVGGYLTMGIAAEHFHNERYLNVTDLLKRNWGKHVIGGTEERPTIDIVELVRAQLRAKGVDTERVHWDALDTFSDPRLASVRAGRGGHNLVIAMRM
jgi:hypothetical protein